MKQAIITMLEMQTRMNTRVHPEWITQEFEWYRAAWIECGELIDHFGYKWWKKQVADMEQVRLEIVDIWHFGMSALFVDDKTIDQIADEVVAEIASFKAKDIGVREATETLALHSLQTHGFSVAAFWQLMASAELNFESLYRSYVGKNVLNFFRQDNGYQDGSYIKDWQGKEDNEHLVELMAELDSSQDNFSDLVYDALDKRYRKIVSQ